MSLWRSMLDAMIWSTCYTIVSFQTCSSPMFDFCSAEALLYDCDSSQYEAGSRLNSLLFILCSLTFYIFNTVFIQGTYGVSQTFIWAKSGKIRLV